MPLSPVFPTSSTGGGSYIYITDTTPAYTAKSGDKILADTTNAPFSIAAVLNPNVGDWFVVADAQNLFDTNNLTVARNGQKINGSSISDFVAGTGNELITFIFAGGQQGWRPFDLVTN